MSTCLLDLQDRIITDTGSMVAKYDLIVKLALEGRPFEQLVTVPHEDIFRYHHHEKTLKQSHQWKPDGNVLGPSVSTFDWNIPDQYKSIDLTEYCQDQMFARGLVDDRYIDRLAMELIAVDDKRMEDFIRCLIYIVDTMKKNNVIWGLGRGSSCASLIMFIIGVNKVDPILYEIDMGEFYK